MLSLSLALLGGCLAFISGIALQYDWSRRTRSKIAYFSAFLAIVGGTIVWDYQERKEDWHLSLKQTDALKLTLSELNSKFPIVYFPINSEPLANRYAYDVLSNFSASGWPHLLISPNWVVPNQAHGLMVATCPNPPEELRARIAEHKSAIRQILGRSGVVVSDKPATEEFLQDLVAHAGFPKCAIGLIFGQPPSPCERTNHAAPWLPNPWCLATHRAS